MRKIDVEDGFNSRSGEICSSNPAWTETGLVEVNRERNDFDTRNFDFPGQITRDGVYSILDLSILVQ